MGGRKAKDFMQFMENPREGPPPPPPEPQWSDVPSHVHHLTDDNFDEFMEEHDSVLVMFYAPCKFSLLNLALNSSLKCWELCY